MTQGHIRQKGKFWTTNRINGSLASPRRTPILETKSVTKKQIKECIAEIQVQAGFESRKYRWKASAITIELKRILPKAVVLYLNRDEAIHEGVVSPNTAYHCFADNYLEK